MTTVLLVDVSNLAWRALHAFSKNPIPLTYQNKRVETLFGFLRDTDNLRRLFSPSICMFCFDEGPSLRKTIYPDYKEGRGSDNPSDKQVSDRRALREQVCRLREEVLPAMGYQNMVSHEGYEADDLIASCCLNLPRGAEAVIVSSDQDLYQLLSNRVSIYNAHAKRMVTIDSFRQTYGIIPQAWPKVKAIAGDDSDGVPGVPRVGISTAIKHLKGDLGSWTKAHRNIKMSSELIRRNIKLVTLPYPGTPVPDFIPDNYSDKKWNEVVKSLGMDSLVKEYTGFGKGMK